MTKAWSSMIFSLTVKGLAEYAFVIFSRMNKATVINAIIMNNAIRCNFLTKSCESFHLYAYITFEEHKTLFLLALVLNVCIKLRLIELYSLHFN